MVYRAKPARAKRGPGRPRRTYGPEAQALYNSGWTLAELATRYGVTINTMYLVIDTGRSRGRPKGSTSKSKVNKEEAQRLFNDGWTLAALGQRYGVTRERVRQKIDTSYPKRRTIFDRTCLQCGQSFQGARHVLHCKSCYDLRQCDLCACGKLKKKPSARCCECRPSKFPWHFAGPLYRMGYGLEAISRCFGASGAAAVLKVLKRFGVRTRSHSQGIHSARRAKKRLPIEDAFRDLMSTTRAN